MATTITLDHVEAGEKLTCEAYWKLSANTHYDYLGNAKEFADASEASTVRRMVSEDGFRRVADEQVDVTAYAYDLTFDAQDIVGLGILSLGTAGSTVQQAAATAPAGTASITSVEMERWHNIGKQGLDTLVAAVGVEDPLTEGTDYVVDYDAGMIKFTGSSGDVEDGDTVGLTFGNDAIDYEVVTGLDTVNRYGSGLFFLVNQFSKTPLYTITFTGNIVPTEWPSQTGEFGQWKFRATAMGKPQIKRRSAA